MEEHYRRKKPGSELNLRNRLNAVHGQVSFASFASEMISGNAGGRVKYMVTKHTGIDEGPQL
jgi:hypothetical protein